MTATKKGNTGQGEIRQGCLQAISALSALAVQIDGSGNQMARLQLSLHLKERKRIGDDEKKQGGQIEYERALETVRLIGEQRGAAAVPRPRS